jgi:amidase
VKIWGPDSAVIDNAAIETASAVTKVLDAGGSLVGKTLTDELAYSLSGQNYHYGTPVNPRNPQRLPGGSSSGSAAVVAGSLVDFALGTDCGGSVRVPASYCGLLGIRPTHGRVSLDGAIPFAPSFDCAGWFARDIEVFERVGGVLLGNDRPAGSGTSILIASDGLDQLLPDVRDAFEAAIDAARQVLGRMDRVTVSEQGLDQWSATFRTIQASEVWGSLGSWIEEVGPTFGPGVRERFATAAGLDKTEVANAQTARKAIQLRLDVLMRDAVLVMPTVPGVAPRSNSDETELEVNLRHQAMNLLCVAGLGGLPQISMPLVEIDGMPIGLSLVGQRGSDKRLIRLAKRLVTESIVTKR